MTSGILERRKTGGTLLLLTVDRATHGKQTAAEKFHTLTYVEPQDSIHGHFCDRTVLVRPRGVQSGDPSGWW
jgi:hypothetical protein